MLSNVSFGEWMKKRRKALDLTQLELAKRVGCAVVSIQKIESNELRPSKQLAELLADHLNIPINERLSFVKFARLKIATIDPNLSTQAAYRLAWSLAPHHSTNLPTQPTPLIGRESEVISLHKRLAAGNGRLFTLVGPPGVGKTRLAIEVASSLLDEFGDGVYLVPLASFNDPEQVPGAIAQTLGITGSGYSYLHGIKAYLRDKHILLVLDNFEQLGQAATYVNELLVDSPWLSILVTSRIPLQIRFENQFPVLPLTLPKDEEEGSSDPVSMMVYSAIRLFVERARAVLPDFRINQANAAIITAICSHLDGLPLAIELVAARIDVLPPEAILERLSGELLLHNEGLRDGSIRHRTLSTAIDWSYALLSPDEQALLARLSVFANGWTLPAADCIVWEAQPSSSNLLNSLSVLATNHLVIQEETRGKPHFTMLETIRAYSLEQLIATGEEQVVRQRHAEYYMALVEEAEPELHTSRQLLWLDVLDREIDNLRSALTWLEGSPDKTEVLLRMVSALGWYWVIRGCVNEGKDRCYRALKQAGEAFPLLRAKTLTMVGSLAWPGDLPAAKWCFEQSISLIQAQTQKDENLLGLTLTGYGLVMAYQADQEAVQHASDAALALYQHTDNHWGRALALAVAGEAHLLRQDYPAAQACFAESLALFRQTGDKWGIGIPLCNWGYTDYLLGDLESARKRIEEGISLHGQIGEKASRAIYLSILAQVVQQQGDFRYAATLYAKSLDLMRKMGLETNIADVLYSVAYLTQSQGHTQLAEQLYIESLGLFSKQANQAGISKCQDGLNSLGRVKDEFGSDL